MAWALASTSRSKTRTWNWLYGSELQIVLAEVLSATPEDRRAELLAWLRSRGIGGDGAFLWAIDRLGGPLYKDERPRLESFRVEGD